MLKLDEQKMKPPFLCIIGFHNWSHTRLTSHGFSSNVLDCKKKCLRCGKINTWIRVKS